MELGILRYMAPELKRSALPTPAPPEISFNYLGHFEDTKGPQMFTFADESSGEANSPNLTRYHALDISGIIARRRLRLSVTFNAALHRQKSIESLLWNFKEELLTIIEHCWKKKDSEKTPGDFTYSDISMEEYESILENLQ